MAKFVPFVMSTSGFHPWQKVLTQIYKPSKNGVYKWFSTI